MTTLKKQSWNLLWYSMSTLSLSTLLCSTVWRGSVPDTVDLIDLWFEYLRIKSLTQ